VRDVLRRERREQRAVLRDACHEMRTPVAAVRALVRAARREGGLDAAQRDEALRLVEEHAEQLAALLEDLSVFADGTDGAPPLHRTDAWLSDVVRGATDAAGLPPSRLRLRVADSAAFVRIDVPSVRQVLTNLVENSRRYGDPEGVVDVEADAGRGLLSLVVRDRPAAAAVPPVGQGLGTAIVERAVRRLGGRMSSGPDDGGGRVVRVDVPVPGGARPLA